ncbi:F510_1955 family glycosylhydrolase [Klenkia sp. PcliD-1-E]|uniref:F510_1955 family glycosylhydrolase n=1 Tax=Klenkia sp. PcliD-1-E TaxID=2954492 RepID=UPI0020985AD2|nr:sialidase family protein [Klenkia sp. PcliD-1-E]MCO7220417.1 glycoside hydrolase [Klenkia sp. PcliD-1-E]
MTALLALAGCSPGAGEPSADTAPDPAGLTEAMFGHVHAVLTDPDSGQIQLATHLGLFVVDPQEGIGRVGPALDLMALAEGGAGRLLASGHPGLQSDLPDPAGLIESHDGGRTWVPVSRGGRSDFHALAPYDGGLYGWDGALMHTTDEQQWSPRADPSDGGVLTASPDGTTVLVSDGEGLRRSTDGALSWSGAQQGPPLQVIDWSDAGSDVAGVTPGGVLWSSADGGQTWTAGDQLDAAPQAIEVRGTGTGRLVTVVTAEGIWQATGAQPLAPVTIEP